VAADPDGSGTTGPLPENTTTALARRGLDVAARYLPVGDAALGGDWHDVVVLPTREVFIAVGDVAGHGPAVAHVCLQLRQALRTYLVTERSPGGALRRLNELAADLLPSELATAVVVTVSPGTGEVRVAGAGHPPAVVCDGDATAFVDDGNGPAVGLAGDARYDEVDVTLAPGASLVLYTDGLVERRGTRLDERLRLLAAAAGETSSEPADAQCEHLIERLGAVGADDEVTVVVVHRLRQGAEPR
jgi:serine phosphatase RsbU (regulator of sigma subunit)